MRKNKLTWYELCEIISRHIGRKKSFTILCDELTALDIVDYVDNIIIFDDYDVALNDEDEYLVSFDYICGETSFYVEPLRANSGKIKGHETQDLFVSLDLGRNELLDKISFETLSYFELMDCAEDYDDDLDSNCDCVFCNISNYVEDLQKTNCPCCIEEIVHKIIIDTINTVNRED